jgi:hypothetical protein
MRDATAYCRSRSGETINIVSRPLYLAHQDMIENRLLPSRMLVWMALFRAVPNISNRRVIPLWDRSTLEGL